MMIELPVHVLMIVKKWRFLYEKEYTYRAFATD